jgi:hypothetical protein
MVLLSGKGWLRNPFYRTGPGSVHFYTEYVTLSREEVDDGIWSVYFYNTLLCRLDERDCKLRG